MRRAMWSFLTSATPRILEDFGYFSAHQRPLSPHSSQANPPPVYNPVGDLCCNIYLSCFFRCALQRGKMTHFVNNLNNFFMFEVTNPFC